jgi:hypothetical protein
MAEILIFMSLRSKLEAIGRRLNLPPKSYPELAEGKGPLFAGLL